MSDTIKRTYEVVITKEITVELPASYAEQEYIDTWSKELWPIEHVGDIARHAAEMAATGMIGVELDGLGLLGYPWSKHPRVPDVKAEETYEDIESTDVT